MLVAVDEFAGIRFGPIAADAGAGSLQSVVVVGDDRDPAWDDARLRRAGVGRAPRETGPSTTCRCPTTC